MTPWILLRGLTRESGHWGSVPEILGRELGGPRILAPDLPGNGVRNGEKSPLSVEAMADSVRADLLRQDVAPPYYLLAMSLGAMAAVAWAARFSQEIAGCVLINTSLRPFSPLHRRLKPGNYLRLLKLAAPGTGDLARERTILQLTSRHLETPDHPERLLADWVECRRRHPVSVGNALRQLVAAACYRAPGAKPEPPILILSARDDGLVDASCSREIAERWSCPSACHPTAGHDLPLDDGAWVAGQVAGWLKTLR